MGHVSHRQKHIEKRILDELLREAEKQYGRHRHSQYAARAPVETNDRPEKEQRSDYPELGNHGNPVRRDGDAVVLFCADGDAPVAEPEPWVLFEVSVGAVKHQPADEINPLFGRCAKLTLDPPADLGGGVVETLDRGSGERDHNTGDDDHEKQALPDAHEGKWAAQRVEAPWKEQGKRKKCRAVAEQQDHSARGDDEGRPVRAESRPVSPEHHRQARNECDRHDGSRRTPVAREGALGEVSVRGQGQVDCEEQLEVAGHLDDWVVSRPYVSNQIYGAHQGQSGEVVGGRAWVGGPGKGSHQVRVQNQQWQRVTQQATDFEPFEQENGYEQRGPIPDVNKLVLPEGVVGKQRRRDERQSGYKVKAPVGHWLYLIPLNWPFPPLEMLLQYAVPLLAPRFVQLARSRLKVQLNANTPSNPDA
jgi:hypothetical protein